MKEKNLLKLLQEITLQALKIQEEQQKLEVKYYQLESVLGKNEYNFCLEDGEITLKIIEEGWRAEITPILEHYPTNVESTVNKDGKEALRFTYRFEIKEIL